MARRRFTNIILAFGLLCSLVASTAAKAQQVTFAISPTQVNPVVGDTLKLDISVQNFTNIVSFQYAVEWDGALLGFVAMDSVFIPDPGNFLTNAFGGNTLLVGWNASGTAKSAPNGRRIFRLRLKVLAASTNYWAKFSDTNTSIEVIQDPGLRSVTPLFVNLGTPPGTTTLPVGSKATGGSTLTGQKFCVPVTTTDFTNIVSAQWVNKWNPAVLRFDSISTLNNTLGLRAANFGTTQTGTGRLAFSWNATSGSVSVNNNDTLYKVCYTAIGANGTNSIVTFDSAEVYRRGGGSDNRVALNGANGTVTVGTVVLPPTTGLVFAASNHVLTNVGDTACMRIRVGSFTDVAIMQWSMHWDSTKMTLVGITSTAGVGIAGWNSVTDQGDFNNLINGNPSGTLRFLWASPSGNGYTLADSTILMELCFKYIGAAGTNTTFRFDGIPLRAQVKDANLMNLPFAFRTGNVSIGTSSAISLTSAVQNVNCSSGTDGQITLTPSGGNGAYTYAWTGPNSFTSAANPITARIAGKYYVTVTSGATSKVDSFTITQPAAVAATTVLTQVSCNGGTNGTIVTTPSGGTGPYTYSWLMPNATTVTTKDLSSLAAGIYKLTITDSKTCTGTRNDTITAPSVLAATTVLTQVNCNGGTTGVIVTTPSGGTAPYTYSWLMPNATTVISKDLANLAAGIYKLTVTDNKSCTATRTDTITAPSVLAASTVATNVICKNGNGGTIVTTPSGGTAPYSYLWSNGAITKDLATLVAGTYTLTLTDSKLCTTTRVQAITEPDSVRIGTATITGTRCSQSTGAISVTTATGGTSGYTYAWTGPNTFTSANQNIANLAPGTYTLIARDTRQCQATRTFEVMDTAANIINSTPSVTSVLCNGGSTGAITLTATGSSPLTYAWTGPNSYSATTLAITGLKAGNYTLSITDAGCTKTVSVTVTEPTAIVTGVQSVNVKCKGDLTGSIALNATSGTGALTITWTGPNGYTATGQNIGALAVGTYVARIRDANNCERAESITITEPSAALAISNENVTNVACNGGTTGKITLTVAGGTPQYSYAWTGVGGFTATQKDIDNLRGGEYRLTVTDANGCKLERTFNVVDPQAIVVNAGTTDASGAPNGTITLSVSGGQSNNYTFLWTGQGVAPTAQNQTGLCSGTYNVTVKDNAQCTVQKSVTVGGSCSTPIRITSTAAPINAGCSGQNLGKIEVTWEGGVAPFRVDWLKLPTNDIINTTENILARSATLASQPAGSYRIKITDAIGQSFLSTVYVINGTSTPLSINIAVTNESCGGNDGSIALTVGNGANPYTYAWTSPQPNVTAQPPTRTLLAAGTYGVTVTDANGCAKDTGGIVVRRTPCALTTTSTKVDPSCFGSTNGAITINITNGEPAYTIRWVSNGNQQTVVNNAGSRGGTHRIDGLGAGTYNVTVTDAANQTQTITHTLTPPTQIVANRTITGDLGTCTGSIVLNVSGGTGTYTYQWNTGATSRDLFNLCCNDGRTYSVIVKDGNDCRVSTNNDVIPCNIAVLSLDTGRISDPLCASDPTNSRIEVLVRGGVTPYIYEWRNQAGTVVGSNSPILTNQPPGRYYLTVLDSRTPNPQRLVFEAPLKIKSTLNIATLTTDARDNITPDGSTQVTITPGRAPYTIRWQDGTSTETPTLTATNSTLKAGKGELTLTDADGCVIRKEVTINSKAFATIRVNTVYSTPTGTVNLRCASNCDGGATIIGYSPEVILPIRTYQWKSGEVGSTAFKLCGGLQTVTVTDANGRAFVTAFEMKAPPVFKVDTVWVDDKSRTIEVIPSGGIPAYKYRWNTDNADTSRKVTVTRSGKYVVLVTDFLGCEALGGPAEIIFDANCLEGAVILSPNDDGRNENFRIKSCNYKNIRLEVYNRWGQLVYFSTNYTDQWYGNKTDGPSGEQLPDGVYMYVLSATDATGKQQLGKGTVNIVRN